jgi:hypothetical protein
VAILLLDLRDDPAFDMDSEWWDRPAYEPCPRCRSGLLGDVEYDYDTDPYPQQQVPHWVPPPLEEDEEEEEQVVEAPMLPVEQYHPPDLLEEEEALRRAIEKSELAELGRTSGQLAASASTNRGDASSSGVGVSSSRTAPPPPPPPPAAEPE